MCLSDAAGGEEEGGLQVEKNKGKLGIVNFCGVIFHLLTSFCN